MSLWNAEIKITRAGTATVDYGTGTRSVTSTTIYEGEALVIDDREALKRYVSGDKAQELDVVVGLPGDVIEDVAYDDVVEVIRGNPAKTTKIVGIQYASKLLLTRFVSPR